MSGLVCFLRKNCCFSHSIDGEVKGQSARRFLNVSDSGADLEKGAPRVAPDRGGHSELSPPRRTAQLSSATRRQHGAP